MGQALSAQAAESVDVFQPASTYFTVQAGYDMWALHPTVSSNQPGVLLSNGTPGPPRMLNNTLYLPNSNTAWYYNDTAPWVMGSGLVQLGRSNRVLMKYSANQNLGAIFDELSLETEISPSLGLRMGVVDYKMSWCRRYEPDSPWMMEPDLFCSNEFTKAVNSGAPGAQVFAKWQAGDYHMQAIAGAYNPLWFNYAPLEFGNVTDGSGVNKNHKFSTSLSAVNVDTGTEYRASLMRTFQQANSVTQKVIYTQGGTTLFAGASFPFAQTWNFRVAGNWLLSQVTSEDSLPAAVSVNGSRTNNVNTNYTLELLHQLSPADMLALGYSDYRFNIGIEDDPNRLASRLIFGDRFFSLMRTSSSLSWRHDWDRKLFGILQLTRVDQVNGYGITDPGYPRDRSSGWAAGLRLGYQF